MFFKIWQNSQKNICAGGCFNKTANLQPATLLKNKTPAQKTSCKFYEIFNREQLWATAS